MKAERGPFRNSPDYKGEEFHEEREAEGPSKVYKEGAAFRAESKDTKSSHRNRGRRYPRHNDDGDSSSTSSESSMHTVSMREFD